MLKRVLQVVASGEVGSMVELAEAVGVSPGLAGAMVAELERRGLLQRAGECGTTCNGCPAETRCAPNSRGGAWLLTGAGRRHEAD